MHKSAAAPEALWVNGVALFETGGSINSNLEKAKAANPMTYISKNTSHSYYYMEIKTN